jgi:hypothetical protein
MYDRRVTMEILEWVEAYPCRWLIPSNLVFSIIHHPKCCRII